ncbi:MAG: GNAT family N-acetyltransferase [Pseudomonadales bacterium]
MQFEAIETARLRLRPPVTADAEAIFNAYAGDPDVTRYLSWPTHRDIDATLAFIGFSEQQWRRWPVGPLLIERRDGGDLIGSSGIDFETDYRAATGYVLRADAWGQGYASEALAAMVALARQLGLWRLEAICHVEHGASARVLHKAGFSREGVLRAHTRFPNLGTHDPQDVLLFALLPKEMSPATPRPTPAA